MVHLQKPAVESLRWNVQVERSVYQKFYCVTDGTTVKMDLMKMRIFAEVFQFMISTEFLEIRHNRYFGPDCS